MDFFEMIFLISLIILGAVSPLWIAISISENKKQNEIRDTIKSFEGFKTLLIHKDYGVAQNSDLEKLMIIERDANQKIRDVIIEYKSLIDFSIFSKPIEKSEDSSEVTVYISTNDTNFKFLFNSADAKFYVNSAAAKLYDFEFKIHSIILDNLVMKNINTLIKKYKQLVRKDDYGNDDFSSWNKEVKYFLETNYRLRDKEFLDLDIDIVTGKVELEIEFSDDEDLLSFDENMNPEEYEHYCADILKSRGLDARVTKLSGDQGADVIIYNKHGLPDTVIQCKLYSNPVGNKAVQEVSSARSHYDCSTALVVSNSSYTKSAKALAHTNNVKLLHHDDLYEFGNNPIDYDNDEILDEHDEDNQLISLSKDEALEKLKDFTLENPTKFIENINFMIKFVDEQEDINISFPVYFATGTDTFLKTIGYDIDSLTDVEKEEVEIEYMNLCSNYCIGKIINDVEENIDLYIDLYNKSVIDNSDGSRNYENWYLELNKLFMNYNFMTHLSNDELYDSYLTMFTNYIEESI